MMHSKQHVLIEITPYYSNVSVLTLCSRLIQIDTETLPSNHVLLVSKLLS